MPSVEKKEKVDKSIEIEIDEDGYPIWPSEDLEKSWKLLTKKYIIRLYLTIHYRMYFF